LIKALGTTQSSNEMYHKGLDLSKVVQPHTVSGYKQVMDKLLTLPPKLLKALEPQYNGYTRKLEDKTVYFSTQEGRSYAFVMPYGVYTVCQGVHAGFCVEQGKNVVYSAIHEMGHLIDFLSLRPAYNWKPFFDAPDADKVFNGKGNLVSAYANANTREDFAEHFAWYVLKGDQFRKLCVGNVDLLTRYNYLSIHVFDGVKYSEPKNWIQCLIEFLQRLLKW